MGCYVEFTNPNLRFDFTKNKLKQSSQISALLLHTDLTERALSNILNIKEEELNDIRENKTHLDRDRFIKLSQYFLIAFGS
jgi:plasmid maintenance system antidote protein VapI